MGGARMGGARMEGVARRVCTHEGVHAWGMCTQRRCTHEGEYAWNGARLGRRGSQMAGCTHRWGAHMEGARMEGAHKLPPPQQILNFRFC